MNLFPRRYTHLAIILACGAVLRERAGERIYCFVTFCLWPVDVSRYVLEAALPAAAHVLLLLLLLLLMMMSTQTVQVGGQFKTTKVTCHHVPLRQHVQEASCGGVQDMRRRGPYGQDVWSP